MAISVAELISMPDLRSRIVAGHDGDSRTVAWAHVCELPRPWEWLGTGDLVMTTGIGIPSGTAAQVSYVEGCADSGIVGVAIGQDMHAPPLTTRMLDAANRRGFCVILTAYEVPFVAVSRVVVQASQIEEQDRLRRTLRVYEVARRAATTRQSGASLLGELSTALGPSFFLVDTTDGRPLLPGGEPAPADVAEALASSITARKDPPPAVLPLRTEAGPTAVALALPGNPNATLIAVGTRSTHRPPDLAILHHVVALAALELARRDADRERERSRGAALLARLVDGSIDAETARERLQERGLSGGPWMLAALDYEDGEADSHRPYPDLDVPHLSLVREDLHLVFTTAGDPAIEALRKLGRCCGVSEEFDTPARGAEAAREARWALELARQHPQPIQRYGELDALVFLPATIDEAQVMVRRVLSPLLRYDRDHGTEFARSLRVFLEENRSWQRSAQRLHIHKQTLIYRMERVTSLIGKRLDRTADVAEIWLALQALDRCHVPGQPAPW